MQLLYSHVLAYALAYTFLQLFMLEVRSFQICECNMNICCYFIQTCLSYVGAINQFTAIIHHATFEVTIMNSHINILIGVVDDL